MKATIHDRSALAAIELADFNAYLRNHGWEVLDAGGTNSVLWIQRRESMDYELLVPNSQTMDDYPTRMSQALSVLEELEDRSQLDVLRDVTLAAIDVIRVRAPEVDSIRSSTPLRSGRHILDNVLEMLAAVASATVSPRRVMPTRRPGQVEDYLKWLELGQSEKGSYVLTILSRVDTMLSASFPPLLELLDTPFPRMVTRTLSRALDATKVAAEASAHETGYQSFVENVPNGVSANLCEAIAGMLKKAPETQSINLGITWALRNPERGLASSFSFARDETELLLEAGRALRAESPTEAILVTGVVINLHREEGATEGTATVACVLQGNVRKLAVPLQPSDYETAIDAHRTKRALLFRADVVLAGRQYSATNVQDFRIVN